MKVQAESFHLNGHIIGLCPQTKKLEPPYKTLSNILAVKGLNNKIGPLFLEYNWHKILVLGF